MEKSMKCFRILIFITFVVVFSNEIFAQKEIKAVFPIDGTTNVNVGILKWSAQEGVKYDLYFGTSSNPGLFKSDLDAMEVKPVILELNKKYYWKIVEKKTDKAIRSSKIFSFSTLPIVLNPKSEYKSFVDIRDYKVYWTISVNGNEWFVQNLDYDFPDNSWYYNNSETNKVYGKLYSGKLLTTDPENICPQGWHVPSQQEWTVVINNFGGLKVAGSKLKEATEMYWRNSNVSRDNSSGMSVLPSGSRDSKPSFANLGKYTFFWTSTPNSKVPNSFTTINFGFMRDNIITDIGDPNWSYSIRCIKNK